MEYKHRHRKCIRWKGLIGLKEERRMRIFSPVPTQFWAPPQLTSSQWMTTKKLPSRKLSLPGQQTFDSDLIGRRRIERKRRRRRGGRVFWEDRLFPKRRRRSWPRKGSLLNIWQRWNLKSKIESELGPSTTKKEDSKGSRQRRKLVDLCGRNFQTHLQSVKWTWPSPLDGCTVQHVDMDVEDSDMQKCIY